MKLVLRIQPEEIVISTFADFQEFHINASFIKWKLPKKIDPNNINNDLELLTDHLKRLSLSYGLDGQEITVILPHQLSKLKTIEIPLNLKTLDDKKEYKNLMKDPYQFWKEHDDELVDQKHVEIRAEFLEVNETGDASKMLYVKTAKRVIKDYINLILGANLYPVSFVPEDQAVIKLIESRMTRVERERPFGIFCLTKFNSRLIHVTQNSIHIAKVNIDDLDETLIEDMPSDTSLENNFWVEVSLRMSGSLKQAFNFLKEEIKAPKIDTVYFMTDHKNETLLFQMFQKNFRLANLKTFKNHFHLSEYPKYQEKNIFVKQAAQGKNHAIFEEPIKANFLLPHLGCYDIKYSSTPAFPNLITNVKPLNLHAEASFIENNFKFDALHKLSIKYLSIVACISFVIYIFAYLPNNMNENEMADKYHASEKNLEKITQDIQKNKNENLKVEENLGKIKKITTGEVTNKVIDMINFNLPNDLELDQFIYQDPQFKILGNGASVSEINRFYKKMLFQKGIKITHFNAFKRNDKDLNFFEITGEIITP